MPNVWNKKIILVFFSVLFVTFLIKTYRTNFLKAEGQKRISKPINFHAIDSFNNLLKPGDVVFRHGSDAISDMFCNMNQTDKSFSHLGIVLQHNDSLLVYHSIGGEDNPDEKIRVETFKNFVTPKYNSALGYMRLPLTSTEIIALDSIVKLWHAQQRTFDMKFNLESDEKLYCAEFVYKAFRIAKKDNTLFSTSKAKNLIYVAPDNILLEATQTARGIYKFQ
jgi:hypothetical protein